MSAVRERLPNRRASKTFAFECNGLHYLATVSQFADGRLAEIFISNAKVGSHSAAKDFLRVYDWLAGRDLLIIRADRREPLVIIPPKLAVEIATAAERGRSS